VPHDLETRRTSCLAEGRQAKKSPLLEERRASTWQAKREEVHRLRCQQPIWEEKMADTT
jgi:hypothetical protein